MTSVSCYGDSYVSALLLRTLDMWRGPGGSSGYPPDLEQLVCWGYEYY